MRFALFISAFILLNGFAAHAAKPLECGDVPQEKLAPTYEVARELRSLRSDYPEIIRTMKNVCRKMEDLSLWESKRGKPLLEDELYLKQRKVLVKDVGRQIRAMKGPIRKMVLWIRIWERKPKRGQKLRDPIPLTPGNPNYNLVKVAEGHDKVIDHLEKLEWLVNEINDLMKMRPPKK